MMLQRILLTMSATIFLSPTLIAGGTKAVVSGVIRYIDRQSLTESVELRLPKLNRLEFTDDTGKFRLEALPSGKLAIQIFVRGELTDSILLSVDDTLIDLGELAMIPSGPRYSDSEIPHSNEQEATPVSTQEDALFVQPAMLLNGKDVFTSNAFSLISAGYRPRGYNNFPLTQLFGGVFIDDMLNQSSSLLWSGLTDIMRNGNSSVNLEFNPDAATGIRGLRNILLHAHDQRPLRKIAYSVSNRSYDHKLQLSYCGDLTQRNWIWSFSGFRQWAKESFAPGTALDHWAAYSSVSKLFSGGAVLSLTLLYQNSFKEPRSAATEELFLLSGSRLYNANWGWQNGVKRNARSLLDRSPMAIMEFCNISSERTQLRSAIAFNYRESEFAGLDWYRAPDPRPDYYRNLPSFLSRTNPTGAMAVAQKYLEHPDLLQINWAGIYNANGNNWDSGTYEQEGLLHKYSGREAAYVQAADAAKSYNIFFRSGYKCHFAKGGYLNASVSWNEHFAERFKILKDLLGADYFLDVNDFARQEYPTQPFLWANDAKRQFFPLTEGDRYKYDYKIHARSVRTNLQWEGDFRKWTVFGSLEASFDGYKRTGVFVNGLNKDRSFGKGRSLRIPGFHFKTGLTRKINGRHYLSGRFFYGRIPPANFDQVYIAPSIREQFASQYTDIASRILSTEIVYTVHAPRFNFQLSGYHTEVWNSTQILRFYNDDPEFQSFVDMLQTNIGQRHTGAECTFSLTLNSRLQLYVLAAAGQSFYTRNPEVYLFNENDTAIDPERQTVAINNYYSVTGPQTVGTVGLQYEGTHHWSLKAGIGILDRNYVRINPSRRSARATVGVDLQSNEAKAIFEQERLRRVFTSDLMISKSLRVKNAIRGKSYNVFFFFAVANMLGLNNQVAFGYEQLRFDYTENDPTKFPNKYTYNPGRTFSCGMQIKW